MNLELKSAKPDLDETIHGLFTGQLCDVERAMQDLQGRMEQEQERTIKAAQGKGAKIARDDWKFANWDPQRDYAQEFYAALRS